MTARRAPPLPRSPRGAPGGSAHFQEVLRKHSASVPRRWVRPLSLQPRSPGQDHDRPGSGGHSGAKWLPCPDPEGAFGCCVISLLVLGPSPTPLPCSAPPICWLLVLCPQQGLPAPQVLPLGSFWLVPSRPLLRTLLSWGGFQVGLCHRTCLSHRAVFPCQVAGLRFPGGWGGTQPPIFLPSCPSPRHPPAPAPSCSRSRHPPRGRCSGSRHPLVTLRPSPASPGFPGGPSYPLHCLGHQPI